MSGARKPFRGVIFDMDGVLTDSEPAFFEAISDVLARYGTSVGTEEYAQFIGSATPITWGGLIKLKQLPVALDDVIEEYEAPLMERLRRPRSPLPGARELIDRLKSRGVPIGLCTASYSRWVDAILHAAGLDGLFDAISAAEMVEHTKPNPAPYVLAASKLGLAPRECVAIEDSVNGVTSALRAGTHVVQLRATETAAAPVAGVALVIASLEEFPMELVVGDV
ncbi:MAG: HAD family phosphatase [Dehalococcoidia bacterium]